MLTSRRLIDLAWFVVLSAAFAAVATMAVVSSFGAHPDERDHVGAGQYYIEYWDPPKVGDPRALGAYSNYGVSYLNQLDVVYFLAGKFAWLVGGLVGSEYMALRLFNVGLFGVLMALCWRLKGRWRLAFAPLFVTPQAWYVFSYFNGDALPLFLAFASVFMLARMLGGPAGSGGGYDTASVIRSVRLDGSDLAARAGRVGEMGLGTVLTLGAVLGVLSVSKQNYYVFLAFFVAFVALCQWSGGLRAGRLWIALAVLLAVFGVRYGAHAWSARDQAPDVVAKVAEQMARPEFKPSAQEQGKGFWGTRMRSKGVSLPEMFTGEWKWHVFTFRSAFGKYGGMEIEAPLLFYRWFGRAAALWLLLLAVPLALRGGEARAGVGVWLIFAGLTVGQSLWHSWNNDFQAQGRYLFPMLPMLGCLLVRWKDALGRFEVPVWCVGALLYGLSLWSFVAVGVLRVPR